MQTSSQAAIHRVSELEKVISAMKKVMEKLQEENESFKKSATSKVTANLLQTYTKVNLKLITEKYGRFQGKEDRSS